MPDFTNVAQAPAGTAAAAEDSIQQVLERALGQARILIVDDEEPNVRLAERLLKRAGYASIDTTVDSRRTLQLYATARHDLVLLDLHMPHLDGFAVLQ